MLSGRASGTRHRHPQGADGEAGEGGTGAMGVWRYGLTSQPPTAHHSRRNPTPPVFVHVHRRPWHDHKRKQPRVRTLGQDVPFFDKTFTSVQINEVIGLFFSAGKLQTWMENANAFRQYYKVWKQSNAHHLKYQSALNVKKASDARDSSLTCKKSWWNEAEKCSK